MFKNQTFTSILILLVAMLSIQGGASFAKALFPVAGPIGTSAIRITFAAIMLFLVWRPFGKKHQKLELADYKAIVLYGSSLGMMNLFFYLSLEHIPLGIAVALEFLGPLGIALYLSQRKQDFIWVVLAFVGVLLLLPISPLQTALPLKGIIYALLAALGWALYIITGQKVGNRMKATTATTYGMVVSAIFVNIIYFVVNDFSIPLTKDEFIKSIPYGILLAFFSSALPYTLEMISLKRLPAKTFGILMSMEPVVATLMGFLLLHEYLSGLQMLAIILVVLASLGSTITANKK